MGSPSGPSTILMISEKLAALFEKMVRSTVLFEISSSIIENNVFKIFTQQEKNPFLLLTRMRFEPIIGCRLAWIEGK